MKTRILAALVLFVPFVVAPIALGQMYGGQQMQPSTQPPQQTTSGSQPMTTTTTTKTVYPAGVKGYLDSQMAKSKDKRFHMTVNGRDLALTPLRFHDEQKLGGNKAEMVVDLKGADGKVYEMNFATSGGVVTDGKITKINGKAP
jgi:hypothetical protein